MNNQMYISRLKINENNESLYYGEKGETFYTLEFYETKTNFILNKKDNIEARVFMRSYVKGHKVEDPENQIDAYMKTLYFKYRTRNRLKKLNRII